MAQTKNSILNGIGMRAASNAATGKGEAAKPVSRWNGGKGKAFRIVGGPASERRVALKHRGVFAAASGNAVESVASFESRSDDLITYLLDVRRAWDDMEKRYGISA